MITTNIILGFIAFFLLVIISQVQKVFKLMQATIALAMLGQHTTPTPPENTTNDNSNVTRIH